MNNFIEFDTSSLWVALPEIFLLSAIVVILLLDLFLFKKWIYPGNIYCYRGEQSTGNTIK